MKINITIEIDDAELKEFLGIPKKKESKPEVTKVSEYARVFDEGSIHWTASSEHNLRYLKDMERLFNDTLRVRGYVYLHEVYEELGIPVHKSFCRFAGWKKDDMSDEDLIDFGIYNEINSDAVNGYSNRFILDFNVTDEFINGL